MSGPLVMSASDADSLANLLDALTKATVKTGVMLGAYGPFDVRLPDRPEGGDGSALSVRWDDDASAYVVDDRVGS